MLKYLSKNSFFLNIFANLIFFSLWFIKSTSNWKGINEEIVEKELEIIKAEIKNSGKPAEMIEKISKGKISKFLNDNSLINQIWIMDPKKKVSDILKENSIDKPLKVLSFIRYKVGEGV